MDLPSCAVVVEQEVAFACPNCQQVGVPSPQAQSQGFPGMTKEAKACFHYLHSHSSIDDWLHNANMEREGLGGLIMWMIACQVDRG